MECELEVVKAWIDMNAVSLKDVVAPVPAILIAVFCKLYTN